LWNFQPLLKDTGSVAVFLLHEILKNTSANRKSLVAFIVRWSNG
jgi:hypothetical protein